jgi:polysaccharide biosynthesis protein PslG
MAEIGQYFRRPLRAAGAIGALAVIVLVASAAPALALPAKFWGVDPQVNPTSEQLQRLKRGGVDSIRVPVPWSGIQPTREGGLDWSGLDSVVGASVRAGLEVLPFVYGAPGWAVPETVVPGSHGSVKAPKRLPVGGAAGRAWSAFVRAAAERYGPGGSFWAENPALPSRPLRIWQIWNEPNFKYFVTRPNPAEYGKLVKASYAAIRGADPGARIILAGLFARPKEAEYKVRPPQAYFAADFLARMYKSDRSLKRKFAGVSLHPYSRYYQRLKPEVEELRAVMKANGDAGKGLWVTEVGWSSQPPSPTNEFAKGPKGQVKQMKGAFSLLRRMQSKWHVQRVFWFSIDDRAGSCNFCDGSGLFSEGFAPKPAWYAYVKFAGGTP